MLNNVLTLLPKPHDTDHDYVFIARRDSVYFTYEEIEEAVRELLTRFPTQRLLSSERIVNNPNFSAKNKTRRNILRRPSSSVHDIK